MSVSAHLTFDDLNGALKAAGEDTRLRILALLAEAELTVSDLTANPAAVAAAHLAPPQASGRSRVGRAFPRRRLGVLPLGRARRQRRARPHAGRAARPRRSDGRARPRTARRRPRPRARPQRRTISARTPREWDRIRKLHIADEAVEAAIRDALADRPFRSLLDLGTGTGRILELFGPDIERGLGIDLSLDMLLLARARIERAGLRHCSVRQGDIYDLAVPANSFDVVIIHQVLHFLDDGARAIREAARVLRPGGRLAGGRFRAA